MRHLVSSLFLLLPLSAAAQFGGPSPVRIAEVEIRSVSGQATVSGSVIADQDARLSFEVGGRIVQAAPPGTRVNAGDVLAAVDPRDLQLRVDELRASLARVSAREAFLISENERLQRLAANQNTSERELAQIRADLAAIEAEKRMMDAQLAGAELDLERAQLRAPFAGVVSERMRQQGERISAGTEILRLTNTDALEIAASVPLRYIPFIELGQTLSYSDSAGAPGQALVSRIVNVGDVRSRQFEIRLSVSDSALSPGQAVRIDVPTSVPSERMVVPRDALVLRRTSNYVFRVTAENTAERVGVSVGSGQGDWIAVDGDLQIGDRVVVRGNERLQPGGRVRILED
jgi:RND family efflux transporter MFP subunit